jgi:adenylate cyclase class 2
MAKEIEVRILGVSVPSIRRKLSSLGARKEDVLNLRRVVYDFPRKGRSPQRWLRLRDEGRRTTLTLKEISSWKVGDVHEQEIEVADFGKARAILSAAGVRETAYQENRRERWRLGRTEVDIDSWPKIPPYLEIEAPSRKELERAVALLGFSMEDTTTLGTIEIYAKYGMRLHRFKILKF